jgi:hypothetical protein
VGVQICLPASLEFIDVSKFFGSHCWHEPGLPALYTVDPGNRHFALIAPTLMNFARTSVIWHFDCLGSVITVDSAVEEIGPRSFSNHDMSTVTIPEPSRVRLIAARAFTQCLHLGSLTIPSSVRVIEARAFQTCYHLQEVRIATGSQLRLIGDRAFDMCHIYMRPVDVPLKAKIRGFHKVTARVRDVDGSKRKRVQFETWAMLR